MKQKILVTGGAGYIGSHFVRSLIDKKIEFEVLDNLSRGNIASLNNVKKIHEVDLTERAALFRIMANGGFTAIVHFASFAYVGESVNHPLMYYKNNVLGGMNIIEAAVTYGVKSFILSSTCSIYGNNASIPITERSIPDPLNPYAKSKLILEDILQDVVKKTNLRFLSLRYFNAAGAHYSGEIGESHDPEPHLIPNVINTALGLKPQVEIFGNDYPTPDGTCIRDYIHVEDLVDAHLKAFYYLQDHPKETIINLGTGYGSSVLEIINLVKELSGEDVRFKVSPRREGDPSVLVADYNLASKCLNWAPKYSIKEIILSALNWHKNKRY